MAGGGTNRLLTLQADDLPAIWGVAYQLSIAVERSLSNVLERYLDPPLAKSRNKGHVFHAIVILFRTTASVHSDFSLSTRLTLPGCRTVRAAF